MVTLRTAIFFAVFTLCLVSTTHAQNTGDGTVQTFLSQQHAFEVSYPPLWKPQKREGDDLYIGRTFAPGAVASLSIGATRYSGNKAEIDEAFKVKNDRTANLCTAILKERFPDFHILDHKPTVLGNFPAYLVEGAYSLNNLETTYKARTIVVMALRGGMFYRLTFDATEPGFSATRKEMELIVSTFNYK